MKRTILLSLAVIALAAIAVSVNAAGRTEKGWLGVSVREMTPSMRQEFELGERSGLLIVDVVRDSPADDAGLWEDDVILKYDGTAVELADEFARLVRQTEPAKSVSILISRDREEKQIEVEIAKRKPKKSFVNWGDSLALRFDRPQLGVYVHELNADLAPYFKVEKESGALISEVVADSPAETAGLKAGDVIVRIDDIKISHPKDLYEDMEDYAVGDTMTVEYIRKGKAGKVGIELERSRSRGFRIGGPSADRLEILPLDRVPGVHVLPRPPKVIHRLGHADNSI
jgi:serine protease Do